MVRLLFFFVAMMLATLNLNAQLSARPDDGAISPPGTTSQVPAGVTVTDSKGRKIANCGTNENGGVNIGYTGKLRRTGPGEWEISGEITSVTNPGSQGSNGPVCVDTNGERTIVNLNKNGSPPGTLPGPLPSTVSGGNATVHVSGDHNNFTVTGNNNTTNVTGNSNTGTVAGAGNSVNMGGRGNAVTSGGTTFRN